MPALTYLSAIRFSEPDAGDFLQNQLSADVMALANGESTFACYCEPKGRVLSLMLVSRVNDVFYAIVSNDLASTVATRMKIYVMRSKVNIEVLEKCAIAGVSSDTPSSLLDSVLATIPIPDSEQNFLILDQGAKLSSDQSAQMAWKHSELEKGITWLNTETSGEFIPQMLGYDQIGAVNFRKGCYPGQEIVARTHYLGKIKRHPRVLTFDPVPCGKAMEKIQLLSDGQPQQAIVVDCVQTREATRLLVVTRLPPESIIDSIEYQGQPLPLR